MHKKNLNKDSTLERLVKETAQELGIKIDVVWKVYNHFYEFIYRLLTKDHLKYFTYKKKREEAVNVTIPGFGRILNRYGKTYRDKGAVEEQHKKENYVRKESTGEET